MSLHKEKNPSKNPFASTLAQAEHRAQIWSVLADLLGGTERARHCATGLLGEWHDGRFLLGLSQAAIQRRSGCSVRQARCLHAALRLCVLCGDSPPRYRQKVHDPQSAAKLVRGLAMANVERVWVVGLSAQAEVLGVREVARGAVHRCSVEPRAIFEFLLDIRAHRGLVAHNHPSGDLTPSDGDRVFTARLVELGEQLGLPIVDHLLISRRGFSSAVEDGWYVR